MPNLEKVFLKKNCADIEFCIKNGQSIEKVFAHKAILAAGSANLSSLFEQNYDIKDIDINNVTVADFENFLFSFYCDTPERRFSTNNVSKILELATIFEVEICIEAVKRFLMNLPITEIGVSYAIAKQFDLLELKWHCIKQINAKKPKVFLSESLVLWPQHILHDVLSNVTVTQVEVPLVVDGILNWATVQCEMQSEDPTDVKMLRKNLGNCQEKMLAIASKDGEFLNRLVNQYQGLFDDAGSDTIMEDITLMDNNDEPDVKNETFVCNPDINHNETAEVLELARFPEVVLSPIACYRNERICIGILSNKRIKLNGLACTSVSGAPTGTLKITMLGDDDVKVLTDQRIITHAHNAINIGNVVFEPNKRYIINITVEKHIIYRPSLTYKNTYEANDLKVSITPHSNHDVISHLFFSECA